MSWEICEGENQFAICCRSALPASLLRMPLFTSSRRAKTSKISGRLREKRALFAAAPETETCLFSAPLGPRWIHADRMAATRHGFLRSYTARLDRLKERI